MPSNTNNSALQSPTTRRPITKPGAFITFQFGYDVTAQPDSLLIKATSSHYSGGVWGQSSIGDDAQKSHPQRPNHSRRGYKFRKIKNKTSRPYWARDAMAGCQLFGLGTETPRTTLSLLRFRNLILLSALSCDGRRVGR